MKKIMVTIGVLSLSTFSGCAAIDTEMNHHTLETKTKMSSTVFLEPVDSGLKTVFVDVHNTTAKKFNIQKQLSGAIKKNGYRVVKEPSKAHYLLQANVLQIGKASKSSADSALTGGYGGAVEGAVAGAAVGSLGSGDAALVGGLLGSVAGTIANNLVKDNLYTMVTDIQISERTKYGVKAKIGSLSYQGNDMTVEQKREVQSHWVRYRTRVVSLAEKVNLTFKEATPVLEKELSKSIAGIF